jgi:hypothetical protein
MTEAEWLACIDPWEMLTYLRSRALVRKPGARKLRLLACACCRRIWDHLKGKPHRHAVEVAERFADGRGSAKQLSAAHARTLQSGRPRHYWNPAGRAAVPTRRLRSEVRECVMGCLIPASAPADEGAAQCALLRCLLGNPFVTIELEPGRRTPGVLALAQAAYEERLLPAGELDPQRLAVLADALEEAGGTSADVLEHLRGPGPHYRGCWAVDLLLAKK